MSDGSRKTGASARRLRRRPDHTVSTAGSEHLLQRHRRDPRVNHPRPSETLDSRDQESTASFTVMSYNLWKNHAVGELTSLVESGGVDLLCLQEAYTGDLPDTIGGLRHMASTGNNRLGLAIYGRHDRFEVHETRSFTLGKSMHDRVLAPTPERLVAARLVDRTTNQAFVLASFHAAPLTARNSVRRTQIRTAHEGLDALGAGLPALMIGDFNYPLFTKRLRRVLTRTGHTLARGPRGTYKRYLIFRGNFDLVTATGLELSPVKVLPQGASDHLPIVVSASL
jgi:exodeoxyribonuclease-3